MSSGPVMRLNWGSFSTGAPQRQRLGHVIWRRDLERGRPWPPVDPVPPPVPPAAWPARPASSPPRRDPAVNRAREDSRRLPSDVAARRWADRRLANRQSRSSSHLPPALIPSTRPSTTILSSDPPASARKSPITFSRCSRSNRLHRSLVRGLQRQLVWPRRFHRNRSNHCRSKRLKPEQEIHSVRLQCVRTKKFCRSATGLTQKPRRQSAR